MQYYRKKRRNSKIRGRIEIEEQNIGVGTREDISHIHTIAKIKYIESYITRGS